MAIDSELISRLGYTPECDFWGCENMPIGGNAFCDDHRESMTVQAGGR